MTRRAGLLIVALVLVAAVAPWLAPYDPAGRFASSFTRRRCVRCSTGSAHRGRTRWCLPIASSNASSPISQAPFRCRGLAVTIVARLSVGLRQPRSRHPVPPVLWCAHLDRACPGGHTRCAGDRRICRSVRRLSRRLGRRERDAVGRARHRPADDLRRPRLASRLAARASAVCGVRARRLHLRAGRLAVRGQRRSGIVAVERDREYVLAARSLGAEDYGCWPGISFQRARVPGGAGDDSAARVHPCRGHLSFVGLGFPDAVPSWGTMLIEAANVGSLARFPWTLSPAVAIFLVAMSANILTSPRDVR